MCAFVCVCGSVLAGAMLSVLLAYSSTSQWMLSTANKLNGPTPVQLWENYLTTAVMLCPLVCRSSDLFLRASVLTVFVPVLCFMCDLLNCVACSGINTYWYLHCSSELRELLW